MKRILTLLTIMVLSAGMVSAQTDGSKRKQKQTTTTTTHQSSAAKKRTTTTTSKAKQSSSSQRSSSGSSSSRSSASSSSSSISNSTPKSSNSNQNNSHKGQLNGYEYVDLGLSVKWATCNIGATAPEGFGQYFAWGEVYTKSRFTQSTYTFTDNVGTLDLNHDVASKLLGGTWRIPTSSEMQELCNKCKWSWTSVKGVTGYRVTGKNGASIFLPSAGFYNNEYTQDLIERNERSYYWSSTIEKDCPSDYAYFLQLLNGCYRVYYHRRWMGCSIRPVCKTTTTPIPRNNQSSVTRNVAQADVMPEESISSASGILQGHGYVDLGLPSGTLWSMCNIDASSPEEIGGEYAWGEVVPKSSFDGWENYKYGNSYNQQLKYNRDPRKGNVDNKTHLDFKDDVAYVKWGSSWHIPTKSQMQELISYCKWRRFEYKNVTGFLIKGPNDNSIFLPNDNSCYTTNELCYDDSSLAWNLVWQYNGEINPHFGNGVKFGGRHVRPVSR